ncbi:ribosome alternative rescue factor ArfA [Vibrio sp. PP-XX7]
MSKKTQSLTQPEPCIMHESGRGEIKDNALHALVTSPLFRTRVVRAKKGKGSFKRQMKHNGQSVLC